MVATNLPGLTLSQAEAMAREMIEALQEEELATADVADVARLRTEQVRLREQAIQAGASCSYFTTRKMKPGG